MLHLLLLLLLLLLLMMMMMMMIVVETVRTVKNILDHWRIESIIL
jgi:hypothetical protein